VTCLPLWPWQSFGEFVELCLRWESSSWHFNVGSLSLNIRIGRGGGEAVKRGGTACTGCLEPTYFKILIVPLYCGAFFGGGGGSGLD
jgi:hypothetical protein